MTLIIISSVHAGTDNLKQKFSMLRFNFELCQSSSAHICEHCVTYVYPSSNKPGYCLRGFSLTKYIFSTCMVNFQKEKFKEEKHICMPFQAHHVGFYVRCFQCKWCSMIDNKTYHTFYHTHWKKNKKCYCLLYFALMHKSGFNT